MYYKNVCTDMFLGWCFPSTLLVIILVFSGWNLVMKDPLNITTESDILLKLDKKIIKMYKVDVKLPGNMI